jgi:serine/threonine protein kinase
MLGQTLGHYRIDSQLGAGGMGVVYKARDIHLGRAVAIKILPPEKLSDPERNRRFTQEAKAASALNHPNIVTIYDIDRVGGTAYIAMELISGKTLRDLMKTTGLSVNDMLRYGIQIADAMSKAHAAGIVHRDLKPDNIMVTNDGLVKLLDFGLAKLSDHSRDESPSPTDASTETWEGRVMGTVCYMSPEQAQGKPVDERSDIFSLGATFYELLTGRRAFRGNSNADIFASVLMKDPEPIAQLARHVPPGLERLVFRCLRKDPQRRTQTMADLKVALEEIQETVHPSVPPFDATRKRWVWPLCGVFVLLAAAVLWRMAPGPAALPPPLRVSFLTAEPGLERSPSISPDGSQVVYSWRVNPETQSDIFVKLIGGRSPRLQLTNSPAWDGSPVWAPDGKRIAFTRLSPPNPVGDIRLVEPLGGPDRLVAHLYGIVDFGTPPSLDWSPDGRWILTHGRASESGDYGLLLIDALSGAARLLARSPVGPPWGDCDPSFAPDGQSIAFVRRRSDYNSDLMVSRFLPTGELAGSPRILATNSTQLFLHPRWSAGGRSLYYISSGKQSATTLWRLSLRDGVPREVTLAGEVGSISDLTLAPARRQLAFASYFQDTNLWSVSLDRPFGHPSAPRFHAGSSRFDGVPQISPDGSRLAFASDRTGFIQIWVSQVDGSNPMQLTTFAEGSSATPRWSPDSQWIAFDSTVDGNPEIYIISAAGGAARRLTNNPAPDFMPSYSPDGQWIYFGSDRSGTSQIWRVRASDGSGAEAITTNGGRVGFVGPDNRILYFMKDYLTGPLYALSLETREEFQAVPEVQYRAFSPAGGGMYYIARSRKTGESELMFYNPATRAVRTVASLGSRPLWLGLTVSPDQKLAVYAQHDRMESDLLLVEDVP